MSELMDREADPGASDVEFAEGLARLVLSLQPGADGSSSENQTLLTINDGAVALIPGVEWSAIIAPADGQQLRVSAVSGSFPPGLIGLQNELGEGPSLDAVAGATQLLVPDFQVEQRWPNFVPKALALGVGSMMCTPLTLNGRVYGSLSLAATVPGIFDAESEHLAVIFATHATIALAGAEWRRGMGAALDSRDVIGQAKGILMERYRLTPDTAFAVLVRASQTTNVKLREICARLCDTGQLPVAVQKSDDGNPRTR